VLAVGLVAIVIVIVATARVDDIDVAPREATAGPRIEPPSEDEQPKKAGALRDAVPAGERPTGVRVGRSARAGAAGGAGAASSSLPTQCFKSIQGVQFGDTQWLTADHEAVKWLNKYGSGHRFFAYTCQVPGSRPVHQVSIKTPGKVEDFLYTVASEEIPTHERLGYHYDGVAFYALTSPSGSETEPIHRIHKRYCFPRDCGLLHRLTTSESDVRWAKQYGGPTGANWNYDGIAFHVPARDPNYVPPRPQRCRVLWWEWDC
jgi:hypothetical protein